MDTSAIDLVLEPGATITGIVTDSAGSTALEGIDVALVQAGTLIAFDQVESTDAEGRFTLFGIEPGDYLVRADAPVNGPFEVT